MPLRAATILDFDCENRPLSYLGGDFTTPELTAVAFSFGGQRNPIVRLLPEDTLSEMLSEFLCAWNEADVVTGHNIRRHDLPLLNAMLLEQGWGSLGPKLLCDTYGDLKRRAPGFGSQATLSAMLGVKAPKVSMSTADWRQANRMTPEGVEKARKRVAGDVRQHIALRKKLVELEWLNSPKIWRP